METFKVTRKQMNMPIALYFDKIQTKSILYWIALY